MTTKIILGKVQKSILEIIADGLWYNIVDIAKKLKHCESDSLTEIVHQRFNVCISVYNSAMRLKRLNLIEFCYPEGPTSIDNPIDVNDALKLKAQIRLKVENI